MSSTAELRRFAQAMAISAPRSHAAILGLAELIDRDPDIRRIVRADQAPILLGPRILAGLHELVLAGEAPDLSEVMYTPIEQLPSLATVTERLRATILAHPAAMEAAAGRAVQQHTPDRVLQLIRGLAMLDAPHVRLLEIGSCAGLTLQPDRYHIVGPGWSWGSTDSPLTLRTDWTRPIQVSIVERRGCDPAPVDPSDAVGARRLHSFLPPEFTTMHDQVDRALTIAAADPLPIDEASAGPWLAGQLSTRTDPDVLTVVWHSLVWHLMPESEHDQVLAAIAGAASRMPIARIAMEPIRRSGDTAVLQVFRHD